MLVIGGALIVAATVLVAARLLAGAIAGARREPSPDTLSVLTLFAPGLAAVERDPRALLVWQPLAATARRLHPGLFAAIDAAAGATFPFTRTQIEAAHARWTTDWLAWERAHDAEYKLKAAEAGAIGAAAPAGRARLDEIEREKLDTYQRRYEEYVRVARALQSLITGSTDVPDRH